MEPQLKQRLVGLTVLVALAVIFIPMFLAEPETPLPPVARRDMAPMPADNMPAEPTPIAAEAKAEIQQGLTANSTELAAQVAPAAGPVLDLNTASKPAIAPTPTAVPPPKTAHESIPHEAAENTKTDAGLWQVQLGLFASEANARALQQKVENAGFRVTVTAADNNGKHRFRVRVGKPTVRAVAEKIHSQVSVKLGYVGMIVKAE